jgi:hypothetical protein
VAGTVLYEERVTSTRTQAFFCGLTALFCLLGVWRLKSFGPELLATIFLLLALCFLFYSLNFRQLVIRITPEALRLQFGIFTSTILLTNIAASHRDDDLPPLVKYGGAGIHFLFHKGRYRASFNFLEYPRVLVAFRQSRIVQEASFSTRRPDDVLRKLHEAVSALGAPVVGKVVGDGELPMSARPGGLT